jgi:hypothetical protein
MKFHQKEEKSDTPCELQTRSVGEKSNATCEKIVKNVKT